MDDIKEWFAKFNKYYNKMRVRSCLHANSQCSSKIVRAHSIQNKRVLDGLSRNGEVLTFRLGPEKDHRLRSSGKGLVSTFTRFCSYHDQMIFKPIDDHEFSLGCAKQEFLFAYRAFAKGYNAKVTGIRWVASNVLLGPKYFQNEDGYYILCEALEQMAPYLPVLESLRSNFNRCLDTKEFANIYTVPIVFNEEYPVAASSMFLIQTDLDGNTVNDLSSSKNHISLTFLTIIPQAGKAYVLLSWLKEDGEMFQALESQLLSCNQERQKVIVSNILATYVENMAVAPSYWERVPKKTGMLFHEIFNATILVNKLNSLTPYSNLNIFVQSAL